MLRLDISRVKKAVTEEELNSLIPDLRRAHETLINKEGPGSEYTGWLELPEKTDKDELSRLKAAADKIRRGSSVLVVIGIGGSYLGARAAIEFIKGGFYNSGATSPEIYFLGNGLSTDYYNEIIRIIGDRDFSVNVISKSGGTTEPAVAFRLFKSLIEEKYGKEDARTRIFATTDARRGALKTLADAEGYECFVIPDDIGGRYSVLTPVGLLPMLAAGIDADRVLGGARTMMTRLVCEKSLKSAAWRYAGIRNALYNTGKNIELLTYFEPRFRFAAEWWKQLFGESEGKENKGIFPASAEFTADLHSLGQYIQQGERTLFETIVNFRAEKEDVIIPHMRDDFDGLNYLSGKSISYINDKAYAGTALAHEDGGVPNLTIELSGANEECFGELVYFFEFSCALSGYMLGVNPFNQPGVEEYKRNMFALLDKPGFGELAGKLRERLDGNK